MEKANAILIVATMDTKAKETAFLRECHFLQTDWPSQWTAEEALTP